MQNQIVQLENGCALILPHSQRVVEYTYHVHADGSYHLRITTLTREAPYRIPEDGPNMGSCEDAPERVWMLARYDYQHLN
jgi:hypothetical protein